MYAITWIVMLDTQQAQQILHAAELIHSEQTVNEAVRRLAVEITSVLAYRNPLVLCVMSGAVVFAGQLLPQLRFPLEFDYVHLTRYGNDLSGGEICWRVEPQEGLQGRVVLVLDDILDEGVTLAAIRDSVLRNGAGAFYSAVLAEKCIGKSKACAADFVGLPVPNRYVFGFGMDVRGAWRNLPAIYALKD